MWVKMFMSFENLLYLMQINFVNSTAPKTNWFCITKLFIILLVFSRYYSFCFLFVLSFASSVASPGEKSKYFKLSRAKNTAIGFTNGWLLWVQMTNLDIFNCPLSKILPVTSLKTVAQPWWSLSCSVEPPVSCRCCSVWWGWEDKGSLECEPYI